MLHMIKKFLKFLALPIIYVLMSSLSSCNTLDQANSMIPIISDGQQDATTTNNDDNLPLLNVGDLVFPLINKYTFTNDYGFYSDGSGPHYGVDLHTQIGSKIVSVSDGVVIEKHDGICDNPIPSHYNVPPCGSSPRGNYITVKSLVKGSTLYFRYMHFKMNSIAVRANETIKKGDVLGLVGNSGFSWGAHLHFEIRKGLGASSRETIDPKKYFNFGKVGETRE